MNLALKMKTEGVFYPGFIWPLDFPAPSSELHTVGRPEVEIAVRDYESRLRISRPLDIPIAGVKNSSVILRTGRWLGLWQAFGVRNAPRNYKPAFQLLALGTGAENLSSSYPWLVSPIVEENPLFNRLGNWGIPCSSASSTGVQDTIDGKRIYVRQLYHIPIWYGVNQLITEWAVQTWINPENVLVCFNRNHLPAAPVDYQFRKTSKMALTVQVTITVIL